MVERQAARIENAASAGAGTGGCAVTDQATVEFERTGVENCAAVASRRTRGDLQPGDASLAGGSNIENPVARLPFDGDARPADGDAACDTQFASAQRDERNARGEGD